MRCNFEISLYIIDFERKNQFSNLFQKKDDMNVDVKGNENKSILQIKK